MTATVERTVALAAERIAAARALLVTAGAGMGVDSGLPDFRGNDGFWRAYPPFRALGLSFVDLASPRWFRQDPGLAWGFYGHRLNLYRATEPHAGFAWLREWMARCPDGGFVFTSNVDGQFQRAGFAEESVMECHGSIHWLQATDEAEGALWSAADTEVAVDPQTMRAAAPYPLTGDGRPARPNILMFGDGSWNARRAERQAERYAQVWREMAGPGLVVIEIGAGLAVPTVRHESERRAAAVGGTLLRLNPRDGDGPPGILSLPLGALAGLRAIREQLAKG